MTSVCGWLTDLLYRSLQPDEREAVCGDFEESGAAIPEVLFGLLGLVVRRQAALWIDWRPWLIVAGLAIPVALELGLTSSEVGRALALDWGAGPDQGAQRWELLAKFSLILVAWSFGAGVVLGSLSRRTIWLNSALFYLVALSAPFLTPPGDLITTAPLRIHAESIAAYSAWGPLQDKHLFVVACRLIALAALVVLPSLWGLRRSLQSRNLGVLPVMLLTLAMAARIAMESGAFALQIQIWLPLFVLLTWPVAYVVASSAWRGLRHPRRARFLVNVNRPPQLFY